MKNLTTEAEISLVVFENGKFLYSAFRSIALYIDHFFVAYRISKFHSLNRDFNQMLRSVKATARPSVAYALAILVFTGSNASAREMRWIEPT
jgi:hypothetical protein